LRLASLEADVNAPVRILADRGYDTPAAQQPPFGAYAPTALQALLIGLAEKTALGRGSLRWMISRMIEGIRPGPVDVMRFGVKQRLHHYGPYFVEKKMLLHIHDYDRREFEQLQAAVKPGCRFVDVGANAGIYVYAVKSWAPDAKILAIEANPVYANRLRFNVAANGFKDVTVENAAAGGETGTAAYYPEAESLAIHEGRSFEVPVKTLHDMVVNAGFDRIDAMKIDIEGFEDRVLPPFFASAPRALWPRLMIVETWSPAIRDLCVSHGYRVRMEGPGMNTIFELTDA
jgi:FkbM family methyltransferase